MTKTDSGRVRPFQRTRAFFAAFLLTLCLVLLSGGLLLADVNTRAVAFGEGLPAYVTGDSPVETLLENTAPDKPGAALLPPALQVVRWLFGLERRLFG